MTTADRPQAALFRAPLCETYGGLKSLLCQAFPRVAALPFPLGREEVGQTRLSSVSQDSTQRHQVDKKQKYFPPQMLSDVRQSTACLEGSQGSATYPSDESSFKMKMNTERGWKDTDRGQQKYWEENLSWCPLSTINLTRTALKSNPGLRCARSTNKRLSHGKR